MTISRIILLLFGLLIPFKTIACTCAMKKLSEWQKTEIENSKCIFIGEVFEINPSNSIFKIKVIESLDGGDHKGNVYVGKNWKYCSPYISEMDTWVVYGHTENGFLRLNACGISRSFSNPIVNPLPPSPEILNAKSSEKERLAYIQTTNTKNKEIAISNLKLEIKMLRRRRDEE